MRAALGFVVGALVVCMVAAPVVGGEEKAWFDLENCSMCKNFAAEEGLMENMKWETFVISDGMMSVAVIDEHYHDAMERASKKMEAVGAKLQAGEQLPLCGFCSSFGNLLMSGAKLQEFDTVAGHISLMTSDSAELVAKIHAHAERTIEEGAKLAKAHAEHGHEGHDHN